MTGNEALALGALHAGIKVATGYPGTPSTGALASLLEMQPAGVHVEWSTNEKVAFEIAAAAAWAGQRALCAMKMSGLNVAYDSLISTAHSGVIGGLVIYVADDPGANAGMVEQDSRGFALMSDLPMLDPVSVQDAYDLTRIAFDLSEAIGSPVFVRLVTANASSFSAVDLPDEPSALAGTPTAADPRHQRVHQGRRSHRHDPAPRRDRAAGEGGDVDRGAGLNELRIANSRWQIAEGEAARRRTKDAARRTSIITHAPRLGIITAGITAAYLDEAFEIASRYGFDPATASVLRIVSVHPLPTEQIRTLLQHCDTILVLEELEPTTENAVYIEAQRMGWEGRIIGKLSGHFERVGEYGVRHIVQGLAAATGIVIPDDLFRSQTEAEKLAAARPITVCAGCPHRGTFMADQPGRAPRRLQEGRGDGDR